MAKLGIGTAQWGLNYGISNTTGKTSSKEILEIKQVMDKSSIHLVDTAAAYGDAQKRISNIVDESLNIVSKISFDTDLPIERNIYPVIREKLISCLKDLKTTSIYGILIHNTGDALKVGAGDNYFKALNMLKEEKLVSKIGVSVYTPDEINSVLQIFKPDIVQVPFNVLNQRMQKEGILAKLKSMNVEIHARSIFMQGALLFDEHDRPSFFNKWDEKFREWDKIVKKSRISRLELALQYVNNDINIDYCILGVDNARQLKELIKTSQTKIRIPNFRHLSIDDEELLNPLYWKV